MDILAAAVEKIELAGVQHAPEQRYVGCERGVVNSRRPSQFSSCDCSLDECRMAGKVYGREVLTTTPPGIYYLTSEDVVWAPGKKPELPCIQLLWVNVPEFGLGRASAHKVAEMLGWRVKEAPKPLPINPPTAPVTVLSSIIEPVV